MINNKGIYYNRQQRGHSVILNIVAAFLTDGLSLIFTIYWMISKNHYFHL